MKTNGNEPGHRMKNVGITVTNGGRDFHISADSSNSDFDTNFGGLTKREYFAATAMQAFMSYADNDSLNALSEEKGMESRHVVAEISVELADALIDALNKKKP